MRSVACTQAKELRTHLVHVSREKENLANVVLKEFSMPRDMCFEIEHMWKDV